MPCRALPAALVARRCAAGVPGVYLASGRAGRGLSRGHSARLNLRLDGLVLRACAKNCLEFRPQRRTRNSPSNAHMPATPASAREPSPCPPCRCYLVCLGRVSVSRPIEGLDSLRAVRTLRTSRLHAKGAASPGTVSAKDGVRS